MMRARGASLRQVAARALRASAVLTLPAAAAGAGLAVALTPGHGVAIAWWLAGCALMAALAGLPLIAAGRLRRAEGGGVRRRAGRAVSGRAAAARRLVAETVLVAASAGGIVVLRRQGLTAGTVDVYSSAAPVLVAIPAAIIVMRGYPVVLRLLLRLAGTRPGISAFVGFARATRSSLGAIVPVFALVLALAVVAFGTMIGDAVRRGEVAVSWRHAGADAVVDASVAVRPLSPAVQRDIAAVPGAARTAIGGRHLRHAGRQQGDGCRGGPGQLRGADRRDAGAGFPCLLPRPAWPAGAGRAGSGAGAGLAGHWPGAVTARRAPQPRHRDTPDPGGRHCRQRAGR